MKKMSEKAQEESRECRECVCGRWVYEDYIDNVIVESCGKERLCPVCVTQIMHNFLVHVQLLNVSCME